MGRDKKNENRVEQFTKWVGAHRALPAWKALGFPAREAYFHLQIRCFAETAQKNPKVRNNNGEVYRSPRKLAEDMGCNPKTAMAALADLQAKGWIVCTKQGRLGCEGQGQTAWFRLTMLPTGQGKTHTAPTKEAANWSNDYPVLAYEAHKPKGRKGCAANLKKQKPAPVCGERVHQNAAHLTRKNRLGSPECGAENVKKRSKGSPVCGAYLITISSDVMRRSFKAGAGMCGKANLNTPKRTALGEIGHSERKAMHQ